MDSPLNIVHLYDGHEKVHNGRGSVREIVWNLASQSASLGHNVSVIERQWRGTAEKETIEDVEFNRISLSTGASDPWDRIPYEMVNSITGIMRFTGDRVNFAFSALRVLLEKEFDIIHVHLPFVANVLVTVAPWLRSRIVYTAHMGELRLNSLEESDSTSLPVPKILRYMSPDLYLAKRAAKTVTLNEEIKQKFSKHDSINSIYKISNGVDISRFTEVSDEVLADVRDRYNLYQDNIFLFVSTLMPRKGVDTLVEAFSNVVSSVDSSSKLLLAGEDEIDGDYTKMIREQIEMKGLEDNVDILGFVPENDLPALYKLSDVHVLPSIEEGFGMTITESMAAGTPVIATKVGAIPEQVTHRKEGLLLEPQNQDQLTKYMVEATDNSKMLSRLGRNAEERAKDFSWNEIARRYSRLYHKVAN